MSEEKERSKNIFLAGMVLSMFCWGLSWASGKVLTQYGGPLEISFFRFGLTFISLLVLLAFAKESFSMQRKGLPDLLCASLLIALYTYFFFNGLVHGKAGAGGVLVTSLNPIISYAVMLVHLKRLPTRNESMGLIAGVLAGSILLQVWDKWQNIFDPGNGYFLLASCTWAVLSLFTARSSRYGSTFTFSLWMYGICSVLMFFLAGSHASVALWQRADLYFWGNLFFSATITTALATTFYFVATSKLGAGKASSFIFLVPFAAALGSWLFLRETPQLHTIIGGCLGISAVYLINRKG